MEARGHEPFSVKLVSVTPDAEHLMAYCARVSSPQNQDNRDTEAKLLKYCAKHGHWSVFEHAVMTVEVETSVAIAAQILRHRSFTFQQFSARYARAGDMGFYIAEARRQDIKNRQNSIDDLPADVKDWFDDAQAKVATYSKLLYDEALRKGIAKEQARFLLPQNTLTRMYMTGSARSWIHYLQSRCADGVQLEHKEVALAIRDTIFKEQFPTLYEAIFEQNNKAENLN